MELNVITKSEFSSVVPFGRLDAEFVQRAVWELENRLRKKAGRELAALVAKYDGPTVNDLFREAEAIVNYVAIDSIDTSDGLAYTDKIRYEDRPSRAEIHAPGRGYTGLQRPAEQRCCDFDW
jgi:hypothetical protein